MLCSPALAYADLPAPHDHLARNARDAFLWPGALYHGAAFALTAGMAWGGADHAIRVGVQHRVEGSDMASSSAQTAVIGGYVIPMIVAPGVYLAGLFAKNQDAARAGAAAIQAVVLTAGATFTLKALTGRPFPLNGGDPRASDRLQHPEYARHFGPPSLTAVAWPSGHTSVGFALAASLTGALPGRWWVPAVTYPVAVALGAGMVVGDHHWSSDVVAGALLGQAVESAVGRGFSGVNQPDSALAVVPLVDRERRGVAVVGRW